MKPIGITARARSAFLQCTVQKQHSADAAADTGLEPFMLLISEATTQTTEAGP